MLEASSWENNAFITLTYDEEHVPEDGSVNPQHLRDFIKRHRHNHNFRYYGVGEYGDRNERPHYHLAAFNHPRCDWLQTRNRRAYCCSACEQLKQTWGFGRVEIAVLAAESAAYIAGYTVKKMYSEDDEWLNGRHKEFARMSNRPGIGEPYAHEVASSLLEHGYTHVPRTLRHGKMHWPLGDYLVKKIAEYSGGLPIAPAEVTMEVQELSRKIYSDSEIRPQLKAAALENALKARRWDKGKQLESDERRRRRQREAF